jgi:hypothetical protein
MDHGRFSIDNAIIFTFNDNIIFIHDLTERRLYLPNIRNGKFCKSHKKHPSVRLLDKTWDICFISLPFIILICFYSENILYVSLRLDSYSSTDCSKQRSNNVYIRKNSNERYLFKSRFGVEQPTLIKSTKE